MPARGFDAICPDRNQGTQVEEEMRSAIQVRIDYRIKSAAVSQQTVMIRENTMGFKESLSWGHSNIVSGALRDRRANDGDGETTAAANQTYIGSAQIRIF